MSVHIYKLGTTAAVPKAEVIELFNDRLSLDSKSIDCRQNTVIELYPSNKDGFVYLVVLLALNPSLNGKLSWNGEILGKFYQLCKRHQMQMRSLRNGAILQPSDGAFFSDLKNS